tara:strand:+ start:421 stop:681 length:261 start_codon:yes stop_codon:yes gene_type:complete
MATLFDYTNQAWTVDGVYVDCGHPVAGTVMGAGSPAPGEAFRSCECYGRAHAGEPVSEKVMDEMEDVEPDYPHPGEILDWWLLRQD